MNRMLVRAKKHKLFVLTIKSHAQMQNQPVVCQYLEENDNSTKLFGANTILAYGRTWKTKISSNVCIS